MRLTIIAVGKLKDAWAVDGCAEYEQRLRRYATVSVIEVKDGAGLAARIPERHRMVALDEHGDQPTSVELAARLERWQGSSVPGVAFLIGGADGLPPELLRRADERLALSRLTLPHRVARLILLEQIYRSFSIVRGEPYHRS